MGVATPMLEALLGREDSTARHKPGQELLVIKGVALLLYRLNFRFQCLMIGEGVFYELLQHSAQDRFGYTRSNQLDPVPTPRFSSSLG
ncbi:hypothetical protein SAMN05216317_1423 [Nitrosomonas eutropha]|nr:hypothetical protein SAMN05216379_14610 [Nitrosomonas eutropha]SDX14446.1 hypothetical protein SAMN05216317_1423 [Nitrosomonas eutropha]